MLGLAGVVAGLSCWGLYTSEGAQKARERDARLAAARDGGPSDVGPTLTVDAFTARRAAATEVVELSGVLEPIRATWVAAEIAGRILEIPAVEHEPVAAGDVLVRLDSALPEADVIRAEADHKLAEAELARQKRLQSVASEAELDRAIAEERRSWAALLEARTRLGHTRIRAPFDGVVNSLDLDPGAYVQPGSAIAEVLDVSLVEVSVPVSDRQIGAIRRGDAIPVRIDPLGNARIAGRIVRVGRAPQAETQRYPIVVQLENPDGVLLPGMVVHAELEVGRAEALRVPSRAVVREFELDYVFALENGNRPDVAVARRRRIQTRPVPFRPDWVEVTGGLDDGARIAASSVMQLRDGFPVRVAGPAAAPATRAPGP